MSSLLSSSSSTKKVPRYNKIDDCKGGRETTTGGNAVGSEIDFASGQLETLIGMLQREIEQQQQQQQQQQRCDGPPPFDSTTTMICEPTLICESKSTTSESKQSTSCKVCSVTIDRSITVAGVLDSTQIARCCARCSRATYCSATCQVADFLKHQSECNDTNTASDCRWLTISGSLWW